MIFYIVNFIVVLVYFIHTVEVNVSTAIVVRKNSKQIIIAKIVFDREIWENCRKETESLVYVYSPFTNIYVVVMTVF